MNILFYLIALFAGIYDLGFTTVTGTPVGLAQFEGKKIMLVNIASESKYASQLAELQQVYEQHQDSLVVIVFPSDDFGNEPRNDSALSHFFSSGIQATYYVAQKSKVNGAGRHPVYYWLLNGNINGSGNAVEISGDFQKILIDKTGKVYARFSGRTSPLSTEIQTAISTPGF